MLFRKKGKIRAESNQKFLNLLEELKTDWRQQSELLDKSFDPSEEVICQTKLAEARYFFLLKEAKYRRISVK